MKYICYWCCVEINHTLWSNVVFIVSICNVELFLIMQALKTSSSNVKQTEMCDFVTYFVINLSWEHILFYKNITVKASSNPFAVPCSIPLSSPVRLLVILPVGHTASWLCHSIATFTYCQFPRHNTYTTLFSFVREIRLVSFHRMAFPASLWQDVPLHLPTH